MNHDQENLLDVLGADAPSERMRRRLQGEITAERQRMSRRRARRRRVWAIAAVLVLAVGVGSRQRVSNPGGRAAETLAALDSASALRRAQAARASTAPADLPAVVRDRLADLLRGDPDPNVRLAAMRALAARDDDDGIRALLIEAVATAQAPILQAHLVTTLSHGPRGLSPSELERLRALEKLDDAARSRLSGS